MKNTELRVRVLLTLQVSLLGMVTGNMRSVFVSWTETEIHIRAVFDEEVIPKDVEIANEIESEVISHLPAHEVFCRAEACLMSDKPVPFAGEILVFQRAPASIE
jgi:hypothetical protein